MFTGVLIVRGLIEGLSCTTSQVEMIAQNTTLALYVVTAILISATIKTKKAD